MLNGPYSFCRLRDHFSCPSTAKAARSPVPNVNQTIFPSVTADGDAVSFMLFCLNPSPISLLQRIAPSFRARQMPSSFLDCESRQERKTRSPLITGVPAPPPGSWVDQSRVLSSSLSGRSFDWLDPLKCGPRHCGQSSACDSVASDATINAMPSAWFLMMG